MSSYFDAADREVRTLSSAAGKDTGAFLTSLIEVEKRLIKDSLTFARDEQTPKVVRENLISAIADYQVVFAGGEFVDGPGLTDGTRMAAASRRSFLSTQLHSLWHQIASMRLQTRYGLVMDNPGTVAKRILEDG
jgi:hypothetical protein